METVGTLNQSKLTAHSLKYLFLFKHGLFTHRSRKPTSPPMTSFTKEAYHEPEEVVQIHVDSLPMLRRSSFANEDTPTIPLDPDERRRRLFETPWGTRLDVHNPPPRIFQRGVRRQSLNPLDCLIPLSKNMERQSPRAQLFSSFGVRSGGTSHLPPLTSLKGSRLPIDDLIHAWSNGQPATPEDLDLLERLVSTRLLPNTAQVLARGRNLASSSLPATREIGYTLFELVCKYHPPLSTIQRQCVWISISSIGPEAVHELRRCQMRVLAILVGSGGHNDVFIGLLKELLDWLRKMDDAVLVTECHSIIKRILDYSADLLEDDMIHQIIDAYCCILSQTINPTDHLQGPYREIASETMDALRQLVNHLLGQDLLSDISILSIVDVLCLVLGSGGETVPSAFGQQPINTDVTTWNEYQHAAQMFESLLRHKSCRLPVLEALESILQYSTDHTLRARIGAVNAIAERVWAGLALHFENGSHDGVRCSRDEGDVPFDDEISILQDIPDRWIGKPGSDALFTRVIKIVRQFVQAFDSQTSPSVRRFLNIHISRIATLITKLRTTDGSPRFLNLSRKPEHDISPPFILEIETLLGIILEAPKIQPSWAYSFLMMSSHLRDCDLLVAIKASQERASPVHVDWDVYFKRFMGIYRDNNRHHPTSRRAILSCIDDEHATIINVRVFHDEISDDLVALLEETLSETRDESLLKVASKILLRELVATISGECADSKLELHLRRICDGWTSLASSPCRCRSHISSNVPSASNPSSELSDCSHHILAVNFLINAFSKMAFVNSNSPSISVTKSGSPQAPVISKFALSLFDTLLDLMGTRTDAPHISCIKSRLAVLQWTLRLRADSDHRIFTRMGDLPEVVSLAELAQRAEISTDAAPFWRLNDVDFDLNHRKRRRDVNSGVSPNGVTLDIEYSMDEEENVGGPYSWQLPDELMVDITDEMTRPSPAITTCAGDQSDEQSIRLPVHHYLSAIIEVLANCRNWGIVSYILCHLPTQLSNKRLFYGRDTNVAMRRLVVSMCEWVRDDNLYTRMRNMNPPSLPRSAVQAILYHCLTVLLSYHNWLEPRAVGLNDNSALNYMIVHSLVHGLSVGDMTRKPCLEALSIAIYRVPEAIVKFSTVIVEKLASLATNPQTSLQILEYLLIAGYTPRLHVGIFRDEDYQRVFGIALMYIQQRSRPDADTITTLDGKESYSLAQHIYRTSYIIFYVWLNAIKMEDRARFIPFITSGLQDASSGIQLSESSETCMDWLSQYTYGTVDPFPRGYFMYSSVAIPGYGTQSRPAGWIERRKLEMENVAKSETWKMGNSIMRVSIMKNPVGWARVVVHRPSSRMELYCHVEGLRNVIPDEASIALVDSTNFNGCSNPHEASFQAVMSASDDSASSGIGPSAMHPMMIPLIFGGAVNPQESNLRAYKDIEKLTGTLSVLRQTPVINPHRVGVLYVAPGQTSEDEILANTHGSLTYAHFISRIGQLVDLTEPDNFFAGGLRAESHGRYTTAWVDDISSINFHVATMMPGDNTSKKGPIGNDSVKIIWNDGGKPYDFSTFKSEFNLINIVVEPQSSALTSAYRASIDGFLRVTLQTAPGMPRLTPIGDFKNVQLGYLPDMLRHCTLLACLFCESWMSTGRDGVERNPLETHWRSRLACIGRSEKYLEPETADGS